jgi:CheY-like chemotaxis protein
MLEAGPILLVDAGLSVPEPDAPQVAISLAEAGYMVQSTDVSSAEPAVRANPPALVVLEADAPGAMALLSRLRKMEETARTPILLVGVAGKTIQSARDAILHGADAFYPRPIDARRVLLKVETYLGLPAEPVVPPRMRTEPPRERTSPPPQLPFERDSGPVRPERTFVLNDAPGEPGAAPKKQTLPEGVISEEHTGTIPFEPAPAPAPPPPEDRSFQSGLSDDLRAVLVSMEKKLFPDAPPLAVPDVGTDDPDELVPEDLLVGLDDGDETEDEPEPRPSEPPPIPRAQTLPLIDTVDLKAETIAPQPPTAIANAGDLERARRDSIPPPPPPPEEAEASAPRLSIHGRLVTSGDFTREDPALVFAAALAARTTGAIRFRRGRAEKLVHLSAGRPTSASSNLVEDRLTEGLLRTGRLPRDAYERIKATIAGSGRRAGAVLVEAGLLKKDELIGVVRAHLEEVLYSVYAWEEGTWATEPESDPGGEAIRLEAPAASMILEGTRLRYGARRIDRLLGGPTTVLAQSAAGLVPLEEAHLLPEERRALAAADGRSTLEALARAAGSTLDEIGPGLWAIVCLGFLDIAARGMPAAAGVPTAPTRADVERQLERRRVQERLALARIGDYFALLGIARTSGGHEIRRAYLDLARAYDPVRFADPALSDLVGAAHEILSALDDAYEVLRDSVLRDAYRSHLAE